MLSPVACARPARTPRSLRVRQVPRYFRRHRRARCGAEVAAQRPPREGLGLPSAVPPQTCMPTAKRACSPQSDGALSKVDRPRSRRKSWGTEPPCRRTGETRSVVDGFRERVQRVADTPRPNRRVIRTCPAWKMESPCEVRYEIRWPLPICSCCCALSRRRSRAAGWAAR